MYNNKREVCCWHNTNRDILAFNNKAFVSINLIEFKIKIYYVLGVTVRRSSYHIYLNTMSMTMFTFITRSYYRKESAASPPKDGTMRNLLNRGLFIRSHFARTRYEAG